MSGQEKSKQVTKKTQKKNGFMLYAESQRSEFIAAGHKFTGGFRELADLCSKGWGALSDSEKAKFAEDAKIINERVKKAKEAEDQFTCEQQPAPPKTSGTKSKSNNEAKAGDPFVVSDEMLMQIQANREIVNSLFNKQKDWINQPIVICSFTLYVKPECGTTFLPAEIGLTAMSLKDGVLDNFARIIDPDPIPKGFGVEAIQTATKLGLPRPGSVPELANYDPLMMIMENFLEMYKGNLETDDLYVFAFDSDYMLIYRCLEWLFEATDYRFRVKILSLDLYAWHSARSSDLARRWMTSGRTEGFLLPWKESGSLNVSSNRKAGKSLTGNFIFASAYPSCAYGIFENEEDVEKCIKDVDNYKYFEEVSCVYHIKSGKEAQNCALNMSNRFAFSLLEVLTLSNEVPLSAGKHYPEVDKPMIEMNRRFRMCQRWGLTSMEENMKEQKPPSEPDVGEASSTKATDPTDPTDLGYFPSKETNSDESGEYEEMRHVVRKSRKRSRGSARRGKEFLSSDESLVGAGLQPQGGVRPERFRGRGPRAWTTDHINHAGRSREAAVFTLAESSVDLSMSGVPEEPSDDEYYDCNVDPACGQIFRGKFSGVRS